MYIDELIDIPGYKHRNHTVCGNAVCLWCWRMTAVQLSRVQQILVMA